MPTLKLMQTSKTHAGAFSYYLGPMLEKFPLSTREMARGRYPGLGEEAAAAADSALEENKLARAQKRQEKRRRLSQNFKLFSSSWTGERRTERQHSWNDALQVIVQNFANRSRRNDLQCLTPLAPRRAVGTPSQRSLVQSSLYTIVLTDCTGFLKTRL